MWRMNADPCKHVVGRYVRCRRIGIECGNDGSFSGGRNTPDIPERFEREQAQHFNAVPWDWGAPGKVIAYRAGAAAQTAGDVGGR